jgi:DNA-binding response OmpR family regulator
MIKKSAIITKQKILLLVEDEPIQALTAIHSLSKYGYKVLQAETGVEAIKLIRTNPEIELVLMDIDLGEGMDGTDAAKEILANRDIPLIFLSSHTDKETVEKTERITSYGYVVKNSSSTVLDASIKMAFRLFYEKQKTKIIEEDLRTHQIELEMQNNEFRNRQIELEILRAKYFKVYHHSPVSQFTLNEKGLIREANLRAGYVLGILRNNLVGQSFNNFIVKEDQDLFYLYQKKLGKETLAAPVDENRNFQPPNTEGFCKLRMCHSDGTIFPTMLVSTNLLLPQIADGIPGSPGNLGEPIYQVAIMS